MRKGTAAQPHQPLSMEQQPEGRTVTPPYLSLDETWRHIAYVSEEGIEYLHTSEIREGDQFDINNPGAPLHGQRFKCTGIKKNARTSKDAEPIPRLVEFCVSQSKYPDLFNATAEDSPEKRAILDTGTWAETWTKDAQKCRRVPGNDETMNDIRGQAFAIPEIIDAGLARAIEVKGRRLNRSTLEIIPADAFDGATIDPLGKLYPANPRAPDAIIYEALRFPRDMVWELWPPPHDIVEIEHTEEKAETPSTTKEKKPQGRPGFELEVQAAYRELVNDGEVDFGSPKTALYGPIRDKVREKMGKPNLEVGLGDEAIRGHIAPLFKVDKAADKMKQAQDNT